MACRKGKLLDIGYSLLKKSNSPCLGKKFGFGLGNYFDQEKRSCWSPVEGLELVLAAGRLLRLSRKA